MIESDAKSPESEPLREEFPDLSEAALLDALDLSLSSIVLDLPY
jgi:hypothetical protein